MIDSLFFDSDCISAFLWVGREEILAKLYSGRIVIPIAVYEELSYPRIAHLKARVDGMLLRKEAEIGRIHIDSEEYRWYYQFTVSPKMGHTVIGKGEAAAIVLALERDGIVASNNLKDICSYIQEYGLRHLTTGDILMKAFLEGVITEAEGNLIWKDMLARRRKLGAESFSDYVRKKCA